MQDNTRQTNGAKKTRQGKEFMVVVEKDIIAVVDKK